MSKQNKDRKDEGNLYDKIFRGNLQAIFLNLIAKRLKIKIKSVQPIPDKIQTTIERETDSFLLIQPTKGKKFILHLEFQTSDDHTMIYRIGEHHGMRLRELKIPIQHFVIYLGNKRPSMPTKLPDNLIYPGFELVDVNNFEPDTWISSQVPEEIILAVLSKFPKERTEAILRLILKQLRKVCKTTKDLSKFTQQLVILSRLRNLESFTTKIVTEMPITYDIEKDGLYLQGIEKGIEKGIIALLKTNSFSIEEIAETMEVEVDFVKKVKEKHFK